MKMRRLLIIGAGGHGRVCADIASRMGEWDSIAFLDDNTNVESVLGFPVLGAAVEAEKYFHDSDIFVGIGNNEVRASFLSDLEEEGIRCPILVHPSAVVSDSVNIEHGTVIMAGVIINPRTSIGKGCILNTGCTVDHDCTVKDYVHISPGSHIGGTVTIEDYCWLGIGSVVINDLHIGPHCIIGAGAVVIEDLTGYGQYVGVPARKLK
jgi:sugar O-acyltransferase (sialic acid O-acetyltransferase NeuD family)